jgi:S-adenosylmethionine:tRNA ribosyltransferase-isomerase
MRLADFDYELPPERIAQTPIEPRDSARLLVDRGGLRPDHRQVRELPEILQPGDLLVVNETRVLPARLRLHRASGGAAEVLLLDPLDGGRRTWEALVRPARKLRSGETLFAPDGSPVVEVGGRTEAGDTFRVALIGSVDSLDLLDAHGEMPLPPYITERLDDAERYQTVYARLPGSAAAPTAGLHFTPQLFERLDAAGVAVAKVELVVGLDTFRPTGSPSTRSSAAAPPSAWSRSGRLRYGHWSRRPPPACWMDGPASSSIAATTGSWWTC